MTSDPLLEILIILFVVSVVVFLILLMYRSRLHRLEDDAFRTMPERLTDAQKAVLKRAEGLSKPMWIVGVLMVVFLLAMVSWWIILGLGLA